MPNPTPSQSPAVNITSSAAAQNSPHPRFARLSPDQLRAAANVIAHAVSHAERSAGRFAQH